MQLFLCSQARHFCRMITAVPVFAHIRSFAESARMAPVGHTLPHTVQRGSQYLRSGVIAGLNMPAKPAANHMGCRVLVGQAAMHSPQRTQEARKAASGSAPGGRIKRGAATRPRASSPVTARKLLRLSAAVPAPAAAESRNFLRAGEGGAAPASGLLFFFSSAAAARGLQPNATASCGQTD